MLGQLQQAVSHSPRATHGIVAYTDDTHPNVLHLYEASSKVNDQRFSTIAVRDVYTFFPIFDARSLKNRQQYPVTPVIDEDVVTVSSLDGKQNPANPANVLAAYDYYLRYKCLPREPTFRSMDGACLLKSVTHHHQPKALHARLVKHMSSAMSITVPPAIAPAAAVIPSSAHYVRLPSVLHLFCSLVGRPAATTTDRGINTLALLGKWLGAMRRNSAIPLDAYLCSFFISVGFPHGGFLHMLGGDRYVLTEKAVNFLRQKEVHFLEHIPLNTFGTCMLIRMGMWGRMPAFLVSEEGPVGDMPPFSPNVVSTLFALKFLQDVSRGGPWVTKYAHDQLDKQQQQQARTPPEVFYKKLFEALNFETGKPLVDLEKGTGDVLIPLDKALTHYADREAFLYFGTINPMCKKTEITKLHFLDCCLTCRLPIQQLEAGVIFLLLKDLIGQQCSR